MQYIYMKVIKKVHWARLLALLHHSKKVLGLILCAAFILPILAQVASSCNNFLPHVQRHVGWVNQ